MRPKKPNQLSTRRMQERRAATPALSLRPASLTAMGCRAFRAAECPKADPSHADFETSTPIPVLEHAEYTFLNTIQPFKRTPKNTQN